MSRFWEDDNQTVMTDPGVLEIERRGMRLLAWICNGNAILTCQLCGRVYELDEGDLESTLWKAGYKQSLHRRGCYSRWSWRFRPTRRVRGGRR